jgi:hypothetical protein
MIRVCGIEVVLSLRWKAELEPRRNEVCSVTPELSGFFKGTWSAIISGMMVSATGLQANLETFRRKVSEANRTL